VRKHHRQDKPHEEAVEHRIEGERKCPGTEQHHRHTHQQPSVSYPKHCADVPMQRSCRPPEIAHRNIIAEQPQGNPTQRKSQQLPSLLYHRPEHSQQHSDESNPQPAQRPTFQPQEARELQPFSNNCHHEKPHQQWHSRRNAPLEECNNPCCRETSPGTQKKHKRYDPMAL